MPELPYFLHILVRLSDTRHAQIRTYAFIPLNCHISFGVLCPNGPILLSQFARYCPVISWLHGNQPDQPTQLGLIGHRARGVRFVRFDLDVMVYRDFGRDVTVKALYRPCLHIEN